ncbi:hypothetical protein, partial [Parafilimonas sp.]|uniref:hypothetical protein n=1 Tax=Parafilimonas sp. TaxID=1969739 RepID=UPI0039E2EFB8
RSCLEMISGILYSSKNSYFLLALTSNSAKSSNFFYLKMAMVIENIKYRQLLRFIKIKHYFPGNF